jgi:hypothetical protein
LSNPVFADNRWAPYFYANHSEDEFKRISSLLKRFRYTRATGGFANDADTLELKIKIESQADILHVFNKFEFKPNIFTSKPEQPIPGKSYNGEEMSRFPSLIDGTEWIENPRHTIIFGVNIFILCYEKVIYLALNSGYDGVTQQDIENANILEGIFSSFDFEYIDPPTDNSHCFCPKFYPEFFDMI